MDKSKAERPFLTLVGSQAARPIARVESEREMLKRRGVGVGPVSKAFRDGLLLGVEMLQEGETYENVTDLDRQYRDGPQVNFVLSYLQRLRACTDPQFEAGFAAVLSDFIPNAMGYLNTEHFVDLADGAEIATGRNER